MRGANNRPWQKTRDLSRCGPMEFELLGNRSKIIKLIRKWFDERDFTEMHTPRLVALPGQEPYLEPIWTRVFEDNGRPHEVALITSPEYAMKRLLAAGWDKIYDLGPCFRNNEPWDGTHDPEFLLLEWYRRNAGIDDLMRDTEDMLKFVSENFSESAVAFHHQEFRRLTVEQAWRQYADVELADYLNNRQILADLAEQRFNQRVTAEDDWDDIYFKIFLSYIEPKLGLEQPTFLYRYPVSQASLARRSAEDSRWADRVELYAGKLELANGFAELSDADEQRRRFLEERVLRQKNHKKIWPLDEKFLSALPGMGNASGIAFGVDRLVMLLTGSSSLNEVVPMPAGERLS